MTGDAAIPAIAAMTPNFVKPQRDSWRLCTVTPPRSRAPPEGSRPNAVRLQELARRRAMSSTAREAVDRLSEPQITVGHSAGIVAGQAEVDLVPDAGELRVMVLFLGVQRDAGEEAERLAEILELEGAGERLAAVLERPTLGCVHVRFSCPTARCCAYGFIWGPRRRPKVTKWRKWKEPRFLQLSVTVTLKCSSAKRSWATKEHLKWPPSLPR